MGYIKVIIGVALFAGTIPMTKLALQGFDSNGIATVRVFLGGLLAAVYVLASKKRLVTRETIKYIILANIGLVGFPYLITHAMEGLPATFGSVAIGVLPLATGLISILLYKENVSPYYYVFSVLGAGVLILYSFSPHMTSAYHLGVFVLAILSAAMGYASGSELAKRTSGPAAVSIALMCALPLTAILFAGQLQAGLTDQIANASTESVLALLYLAAVSQYLGFFPFYAGLSEVGTAKGIQIQLMQPFLSLAFSVAILAEQFYLTDLLFALSVIGCIYAANRSDHIVFAIRKLINQITKKGVRDDRTQSFCKSNPQV